MVSTRRAKSSTLMERRAPGSHIIFVGGQWGDEGKGKAVDYLAANADVVCRYSGANNAGHTIETPFGKIVLHYIPSGVAQKQICVCAHGVLMNLDAFLKEYGSIQKAIGEMPQVYIDGGSPIWTDYHALLEVWMEGARTINSDSTWKAVAQMQALYDLRVSLVVNDVFLPTDQLIAKLKDLLNPIFPLLLQAELLGMFKKGNLYIPTVEEVAARLHRLGKEIQPFVTDTRQLLMRVHRSGMAILFEGAQATLLDQDWGTYNAISSGKSTACGVPQCTGLPLKVFRNAKVYVAVKPFGTRVGNGPMVSEIGSRKAARRFAELNPQLFNPETPARDQWLQDQLYRINSGEADEQDLAHYIESLGMEKGATTGRGRSPGYPDPVMTRYAVEVNGAHGLAMMRFDMLTGIKKIKVIVGYELDGAKISGSEVSMFNYRRMKPVFEYWRGWKKNICGMTQWNQLPKAAQEFITRYEKIAGAPIKFIGTGPGRDAMIVR